MLEQLKPLIGTACGPMETTLVAATATRSGDSAITLWVRSGRSPHPYVVWHTYADGESGKMVHEHGDYCSTIEGAMQCYRERTGGINA